MSARNDSEPNPTKNPTKVEAKSEREVVVTRTFDAPARIVFQAWTTPALFRRWWVPKSMPLALLSYEADIRVGGGYRLAARGESGCSQVAQVVTGAKSAHRRDRLTPINCRQICSRTRPSHRMSVSTVMTT